MFSVIQRNRNKNRTMNRNMPAYMNRGGRQSITGDDGGGGELGDDGGGGELGDGDGGEVRRWRWRAGRLRWRIGAPRRRWRRGVTAMRGCGLCEGERVRETEILTEGGGWWQLGI
ncbi:hypothetical protein AAHE18_03G029000 [Arachis hypogaea]